MATPDSRTVSELSDELAAALLAVRQLHGVGALPPVLVPLLRIAPPPGHELQVLLRRSGDTKPLAGQASAETWSHQAGEVCLRYGAPGAAADTAAESVASSQTRTVDLIDVLLAAERDPRLHFVSLKFCRDQLLIDKSAAWRALDERARQEELAELIRDGLLTTSKVPNPKAPEFPVTAIRLNRQHPRVVDVLAARPRVAEFEPIEMAGRPISEDIIRDRR